MKKTFKIGEYCKGGIIKAETLPGNRVKITCHDYYTKEQLFGLTSDNYRDIIMELNDWTSSYYADTVMDWLKANGYKAMAGWY